MAEDWRGSRGSSGLGPPGLVHLTVVLTSEEVEQLEDQARTDHLTVTDCIRRSLAVAQVTWEAQRRGAKLMIQGRDGELRPVELPTVRSERTVR